MIKSHIIIDMHTHLRNSIFEHTKKAKEAGIDTVIYMANCIPNLDNVNAVEQSLRQPRNCNAFPVSAITERLEGKKLVDIERIAKYAVGFSDDGNCLTDLDLFKEALSTGYLLMVHCEPETEYIEKYLEILKETKNGRLHIQHVSKSESVNLIREAKKSLEFTCETCPQYFTFSYAMPLLVNPPLGTTEDAIEVRNGLADGTIDCIASDYAPEPKPKRTGIARFNWLYEFSKDLVFEEILTEEQMFKKISENPKKILSL